MKRHILHSPTRRSAIHLFAACLFYGGLASALLTAGRPVAAAEPYGNSLDWVPADATIYSASLGLKEQIEIIAESNAWKRFKEIPGVAMGWQMAEIQIYNPEGPAAVFWQLMELPENQQLAKLLGEMFSEEVAFYTGADFAKTVELFQYIQGSRLAPIFEAMEAGDSPMGGPATSGANDSEARIRMILDAIKEDPDLLNVPEMVFAFRVQDKDAAKTQLARLEVFANMALQQVEAEASVEKQDIGESEFIVLSLTGAMFPWEDEAPAGLFFDDETYENLKNIVSEKELVVAMGVWNDYVILSFGKSTAHLESLGDGPAIGGRKEFANLKDHRKKRLVDVHYVSQEIVEKSVFTARDFDDVADELGAALQLSDELPEEVKERGASDLQELADDLKKYVSTPGPMAGFQFLTETGVEGFSYNWSKMPRLDGSQPLEMIQHLGGSPLVALVARGTHDPEDYEILAKWVGKAIGYFEDFALEEMDDDDREEAVEALITIKPLLTRLDKTTRELLGPSLKDGQSAIVLDADIESKQWHEEMPASFTPLPMIELGVVLGVSDVDKFKEAMSQYKEIASDAVDAIRDKEPDAIPADYEIPEPEERETDGGTVYAWSLPPEAGLDDQIALCGAVGENVVAFATSATLAERILAQEPLEAVDALGDEDEPRAVVVGIDFAGFIGAIAPWVEFAIRANYVEEDSIGQDPADDPEEARDICSQVRMAVEILQCFRGAWMETREEDGVWVTHSISTFKDLEDE